MKSLYYILGLGGLIPFVGIAAAKVFGVTQFASLSLASVFIAYSGIILSFLGGTLWGRALTQEQPLNWVVIASNGFALLGWVGLLMAFFFGLQSLAFFFLAAAFGAMYYGDKFYLKAYAIPFSDEYRTMRFRLTVVVMLSHLVMYW